ncbi:MAG TPA: SpvB/TcaC N-terminal domain-containing protein, partial [Polyangium sp.]|nr:SpvB/TcaC N-terminal domain-containing protein [Polyangium sp.]
MEQKAFAPKPNVTAPKAVQAPNPSLPKGGGAVRGLGEKFAANLVSGTGSLTIPIATSPGRGGFGPELSVAYDSGGGNGPFGVGFRLSVPSITRKTERGLPEWDDRNDSDTFILSGAEDLVRCDEQPADANVVRYRPRVEGLFARIERVREGAEVYWRAITKDNVTSIYGRTAQARIAHPNHPSLVFSWLLERTEDARGHVIEYEYKAEDMVGVPNSIAEHHRHKGLQPFSNRYLKRVRYGNGTPFQTNAFLFEVVFDYGEHDSDTPTPAEITPWVCRQDPFSTYRATFEIRTYRLCRRVLMFHHFPELGPDPVLVRSTDFGYAEDKTLTRMTSVTQWGYLQTATGYSKKSLPPLEFGYSLPEVHKAVKVFDAKSMADIPGGVDGQTAKWVDLDGEGLPGVLCERQGAWYFKQNLGKAEFTPARRLSSQPSMAASGNAQLLDVGGEGRQCLVSMVDGNHGYHERTQDGGWGPFIPFPLAPNVTMNDPRIRFIDLSGDGLDDILVTTDHFQLWFPSLGKGGWGPPRPLPKSYDEKYSPTTVFVDSMQVIFTADMTGDGLQDIVRIRNGNICYWPNLGRGQFGAKVQMANAPMFDDSHLFDARRIRFADIDGTGTTDLVYVGSKEIVIAFNQSGNGFAAPVRLTSFPTQDPASTVSVLDVLGTGTGCLVWSSPWRGVSQPPMRYIDLMNSVKPYLMTSVKNNMGGETRMQYASSTKFYLEDLKAGKKWVTRLSFPVHVLERTETYDAVRQTRFVSTYKYHHGYYDAPEREFRGFGLVEQFDAESFSADRGKGLFTDAPAVDEEFHIPPVLTKTWFHTGAFVDQKRISKQFATEYYAGDVGGPQLPDGFVPNGLSPKDIREACRALKGQMLRQEVYALDGTPQEKNPYKVTEVCPSLVVVQASKPNRYGSFFAYVRESVDVHYERNASDPRMAHTLALVVDEYGHVTKSAAIAYARRTIPADMPQGLLATVTETSVINKANETDWYRLGVPEQTRTYELTGLSKTQSALLSFDAVKTAVGAASEIAYEVEPTPNVLQKRLVEHVKQRYYDSTTLGGANPGALPFGQVDRLALPYETYALAFTPGLLTDAFTGRTPSIDVAAVTALLTANQTPNDGGYVEEDGLYWLPTGREIFDPAKFYHATKMRDVFGNETTVQYDTHCVLVESVTDALTNTIVVQNDYRVLGPVLVTDPNGNRGAVQVDELGMVVATAVMGKVGSSDGDTLADPTTQFEYNFELYRTTGKPNMVHNVVREKHGAANTRSLHSYTYLDGLGGELMKKAQAEPGLAPLRDTNGALLRGPNGELVLANVASRWVGTGRVIKDNKGNPVKQYEPFFSSTHEYEDEDDLVEWGVTPILRYDPLGRLVRTDFPDGSYSRVEFTPWEQSTFDGNDTVLEANNAWFATRQANATPTPSTQDQRAAALTQAHANTPARVHFDTLGRPAIGIENNGPTGQYATRAELDIEGNPKKIKDARGNIAAHNKFDMLGRTLYTSSCDAGARWTVTNAVGNPVRVWDNQNRVVSSKYDILHRRTELWV